MTKYDMVGKVPVALERRDEDTVVLRTFSPSAHTFTSDARYDSEMQRNDSGWVHEIPQAEYQVRVAVLLAS